MGAGAEKVERSTLFFKKGWKGFVKVLNLYLFFTFLFYRFNLCCYFVRELKVAAFYYFITNNFAWSMSSSTVVYYVRFCQPEEVLF